MNGRPLTMAEVAAMTSAEAAAYWFVRRDAEALAEEDEAAFQRWLRDSATHRNAYERTQSMWDGLECADQHPELRALHTAALAAEPARKMWPQAAAAAAILTILATGVLGLRGEGVHESPPAVASGIQAPSAAASLDTAQYSTGRNERSTITLGDGTSVSLNLNTVLDVAFTPAERHVHISRGQAFFEVARSPKRPFIVEAADRRIVALGTQFDVRVDPDRVEVVLLEGKVAVDRESKSILDSLSQRKSHVELRPNQRLVAAIGEPVAITKTDAERATSWRQGWVVFENESLADAVTELNRYSERPIVISSKAIGNLRLSGVFRIGQPGRFGAIIQELLPVTATAVATQETILLSAAADGMQPQ